MSDSQHRPKPVVLCILDGWGERSERDNNAIALATTPNWDRYVADLPKAQLQASALDVGLPEGQMGNSEVGHTNLGAGRVVMQDLPRIDAALADGSLATNPALGDFISALKQSGGACHLMGLLSPGGVHSHSAHITGLAAAIAGAGVSVIIHAFLDGRDTPPKSGRGYMDDFLTSLSSLEGVRVGTVTGRYYAMDRDNRWERVSTAYDVMVDGEGEAAADALAAITNSYAADTVDEFVLPSAIDGYEGMNDGDGLFMANFRADRAREILAALVDPDFDGFQRSRTVQFAACSGMVRYSRALDPYLSALFPSVELKNILGEIIADAGLKQLRIAETEKYAHVTFFFNGGREREFAGEERILVPSPKVATYDLQPEMSAPEVTDKLTGAIAGGTFDLIIVNFANGDMVGHTGVLEAAKVAAQTLDNSLGQLEEAVVKAGGVLLITADHGNCEQMWDASEDPAQPHTAHTTNPVPLLMVNPPDWAQGLNDGSLADIAPTLLKLLELKQPPEMTGQSLIKEQGR
ncbi:MAG: 2,3-bisphosphoglycerate-independent phosphoglycerate mutase [Rhodospirillaceae bacterium]|jgi:2,3-bisphosphoglycerate-independent phosphoglycerate mutase|nr:2,3-bisphosphoglycerate-independent phosphoglycerate mutase [Rhodospirillaceae bacterium]MBT5243590.1 2,3-bisphosphoglycerate-independent phosphoglycerate mutase [Rhodospirillaceae bacterium]MBT5562178.1 2,3-bisphosphoglycerate-independent phosphoglycerate mutase [Rhodospirillaceae bacterium]MBT6242351.1 2,3-bisphosphoglycerate-independent phosphoglycerate mutase [Rhodospirillaceae bacterium]MBT7138943.1 2,3-bisphosphoglycerate-independent phosphoglycerate mutase [Rhodospirillaceae bacterium